MSDKSRHLISDVTYRHMRAEPSLHPKCIDIAGYFASRDTTMYDIHLIEKTASYYREGDKTETDIWVTGTWELADSTAKKLEDGGSRVFLHTKQDSPCYLGGEILKVSKAGCRKPGKLQRFNIKFKFNSAVINTTTDDCNCNWSTEMLLER